MAECWYIFGTCWCTTVYVLTGLSAVGNITTVAIVLSSDKLRKRSTFVILVFLALADFLMMASLTVFCAVEPFFSKMEDVKRLCILRNLEHWFNSNSLFLSYLFILMVTVERFAVVHFVFRAPRVFTRKNILIACTGVVILVCSFNVYLFWWQVPNYHYHDCDFEPPFTDIKNYSYYIVTIGTWVIMLVLDVAIMWKLRRNATDVRHRRHSRTTEDSHRYASTHVMLICTVGAFLLLVGPLLIIEIIDINGGDALITPTTRETLFFFSKLNHCVNFFLYVLTCRMFREEACQMCGLGKCKNQVLAGTSRRPSEQSGTKVSTSTSV